ncbi:class I SAM-dependent methyltransferase [Thermoflavifilum thermophilum]|uniref:Ubiquinone/menaquinone biosynthesis C-methylase UbiE n=1 Tax=Thermoflavifilum thermophilum TaxID=1393122 RepID=A0A1I7N6N6_9BACT|nr:class I SAM-dependent methyltransferase [Thermoflavifilum thermophilum]SFV30243.1 Ubiquinone/menaquinone biosynthesis C-methylase UbiE [Thermoflavifilum thermophilum]
MGARAQDWATHVEQVCLPLFGAAFDAARVTVGTRLLDAGCGAGLLALLASFRGAQVTALDALPGLLAIARQRLPGADVREGDLEELPFDDASFDAVVAVNSVFYAVDMAAAMRELVRVVRHGSRVVVTAWGPPEKCEFLRAVMPALGPLMPPPPPGATPPHPGALSEPGALASTLEAAGLRVLEEGEVACPFVFPSTEASWRGNSSAGVNQAAIAHSGEAAVRAVYANADRAHMRPDGSVRYNNVFLWASGERP